MGGIGLVSDRAEVQSLAMAEHGAPENDAEEDRAELYRRSADRLRQLAAEVRFDFGRRQQLLALADAFDRLAEKGPAGANRR